MRTLLASSGSALGRGHAGRGLGLTPSDAAPKERTARGTRTHTIYTIYAVRRVCSAGAHPVASASLAVVSDPPPTPPAHPTLLLFPTLLVKRRGPGGAHTVCPPEWREYGRHGAWLVMRTGEEVTATCKKSGRQCALPHGHVIFTVYVPELVKKPSITSL